MLLDSLNQLLHSLSLPYVLESTADLTPTLLLATLACILRTPLLSITSKKDLDDTITTLADLSQQIPHDNGSIDADGLRLRSAHAEMHQVKQMKLLLGVLENDVLSGEDVGLYEIDPRRLARGEREEVEFLGELFVWLGKRLGYLPDPSGSTSQRQTPPTSASRAGRIDGGVVGGFGSYNDVHQGRSRTSNRPSSPSATTTTTNTESMNPTNLSIHSFTPSINADTITSPPSTLAASVRTMPSYPRSQNHAASSHDHGRNGDELEFEVRRTRSGLDGISYPPDDDHAYDSRTRPRCIHELQIELDDILPNIPSNHHSPPSELSSRHFASTGPTIIATPCEFTTCHCDLSSMPHPRPLVSMKVPSPSLSSHVDNSTNIEIPVRYEGFISPIDEEAEIASFEAASRSFLSPTGAMSSDDESPLRPSPGPLASAHHHLGESIPRSVASSHGGHFTFDDELRLMEERARLLGELALATWR